MKKLLILTLSISLFTQAAFADSTLNFNERTLDSVLVQSTENDDYYLVAMSEFLDDASTGTMSALFYIPKALLSNGTHELKVIKPGKIMRSGFYCQNNEKYKFTLPTEDKIYVVFQDLSNDESNEKRVKFDGVVAASGKEGTFTISDLTETDGKAFSFSFEIETKNINYKYSAKAIESATACKKSLKFSKVKFGKVIAETTSSGNSVVIID